MGSIYSGTGLISGLDYQSIIDKLLALDARPRDQILARITTLDAQKAAFLDISARLTAILSQVQMLARSSSFQATSATSSQPNALSVVSQAGARLGTYQFSVRSLAATHQLVSRGFRDRTAALTPGTLTIESAQARVDRSTRLDELNGHTGVQRGTFKIINSAGTQATIDLRDAATVGEVIDRINAAGIQVTATADGGNLVLTDAAGGTAHLRVLETSGGRTAADLGFVAGHTTDADGNGTLAGAAVLYLAQSSPLASLNDGLGVRNSPAGGDFSVDLAGQTFSVDLGTAIKAETRLARLNHGQGVRLGHVKLTSRDGTQVDVDLTDAQTVGQVQQRLQAAFGDSRISVTLTAGRLVINDSKVINPGETAQDLVIEDVGDGHAALDLGIAGQSATGRIDGRTLVHMDTLADAMAAINFASGNDDGSGNSLATAAIADDGRSIVLRSAGAAGPMVLTAGSPSTSRALADLGLAEGTYEDAGSGAVAQGARILGGLNTVLLRTLNGGQGFGTGVIRIASGAGAVDVNLADAATLDEVISAINTAASAAGLGVSAGYDSTGTRLLLTSGDTGDTIAVSDVSGQFAQATGLNQSGAVIKSNNLQRQYLNERTELAALSNGRGVSTGTFRITNSLGQSATVTLSASQDTLGDVIDAINSTNIGVTASLNATGDGLLISDATTGTGSLKVADESGTTARDLNIAGQSAQKQLDGAFEFHLAVGGGDTLDSLATRIGTATTLAEATLLNDGTSLSPYRLHIASRISGSPGELIIDDGDTGLAVGTLTAASDARVIFGADAASGLLLTSTDNTFRNVVEGLTFTASAITDQPVQVTVARNTQSLVDTASLFVTKFNEAMSRIREVGSYNADTQAKGILLGDSGRRSIETRLQRMLGRIVPGNGSFRSLHEVGLSYSSTTGLTMDEQKLLDALEADPEGVTRLFTDETNGLAPWMKSELEAMTGEKGVIQTQTTALGDQRELLSERADQINELLDRKRSRLMRQFQALEASLSLLQAQQQQLSNLSTTITSYTTTSSSG